MSAFQILDAEGKAVGINQLDKEACEFWGVELHPKQYASPSDQRINWFDCIGWNISITQRPTWRKVIMTLIAESFFDQLVKENKETKENTYVDFVVTGQTKEGENILHLPDDTEENLYILMQVHKPYVDLMNHWASKGYEPKQIIE